MAERILGYTTAQIRELFGRVPADVDPEHTAGPINPRGAILDACLNGSCKIVNDPEMMGFFRQIYREQI